VCGKLYFIYYRLYAECDECRVWLPLDKTKSSWIERYSGIFKSFIDEDTQTIIQSIPDYIWKCSKIQCIKLLDMLDCYNIHNKNKMENARLKDKPNYITYTTDSISVANDISRLAIHCGYSCHIRSMSEYEPTNRSLGCS
jgi:hypothetical protein